ncbi:MAG: hypothetical protein ABII88_08705 [Candidatus Omnitrophota bacterium]
MEVDSKNKNLKRQMQDTLPEETWKLLKKIGNTADANGVNVYVVGGFVRDIILAQENYDIDIVAEQNAFEFAKNLGEVFSVKVKLNNRFKTAKILLPGKVCLDIAAARVETYDHPAALPRVSTVDSIYDDLKRRDFTINAMAVNLNHHDFGRLLDFFNGYDDINKKKIKVLHDLSFVDDPTRIFRAVRFEQRLAFFIDDYTEQLLRQAVKQGFLNKLQSYRINKERSLILQEPNSAQILKRMKEFKIKLTRAKDLLP